MADCYLKNIGESFLPKQKIKECAICGEEFFTRYDEYLCGICKIYNLYKKDVKEEKMTKPLSYFIKTKPVLDVNKFEGFDFIVIHADNMQKYSGKIMSIEENKIQFTEGDRADALLIKNGRFEFKIRKNNNKIKYIQLQNPYSGVIVKLCPEHFEWKDYIDETEYN